MNKITLLTAQEGIKMCKTFTLDMVKEQINKSEYDKAKTFDCEIVNISNINELSELLSLLEQHGDKCIIRGLLQDEANDGKKVFRTMVRTGVDTGRFIENPNGLNYFMIDFDKIPTPPDVVNPEEIIDGCPTGISYLKSLLPAEFQNSSFHYQWSSSAAVFGWRHISAHLWFWTDRPILDSDLYEWAKVLKSEYLVPIDPRVLLTVQANYTAAPKFVGMPDPLLHKRSGFVQGQRDDVPLVLLKAAEIEREYVLVNNKTYVKSKSFAEHIAAIGGSEGFYEPLTRAIAHYCSINGTKTDTAFLKAALRDHWHSIPTNGRDYDAYMGDFALDTNINGALLKFGQHTPIDDDEIKRRLNGLRPEKDFIDLNQSHTDLEINIISAECGSGKSYQTIRNLADKKGKWIYACDKIISIKERAKELREYCYNNGIIDIEIIEVYTDKEDTEEKIGKQLAMAKASLVKNKAKHFVVFVTHVALFLLDFYDWVDTKLVIDEANDIVKFIPRSYGKSKETVSTYFNFVDTGSEDCFEVEPTELLHKLAEDKKFVDQHYDHYEMLYKVATTPSSKLWLPQEDWTEDKAVQRFFTILTPYSLDAFTEIWLLGDELEQSSIFHGWSVVYGVRFIAHELEHKRMRRVPTSQRAKVYYFCENNSASLAYFKSAENPIRCISEWFKQKYPSGNFIYTINDKMKGRLADAFKGEYITPKAHGRNDLQHYNNCLWLAAMKISHFEARLVQKLFDISVEEQVLWREYNPMYQFIMRINIRDYTSAINNNIYVVDEEQARYLQKRLGCEIEHIPNVVPDVVGGNNGRPTTVDKKGMTKEERREYERNQKKEQRLKRKMAKNSQYTTDVKCPLNPLETQEENIGGQLQTEKSETDVKCPLNPLETQEENIGGQLQTEKSETVFYKKNTSTYMDKMDNTSSSQCKTYMDKMDNTSSSQCKILDGIEDFAAPSPPANTSQPTAKRKMDSEIGDKFKDKMKKILAIQRKIKGE